MKISVFKEQIFNRPSVQILLAILFIAFFAQIAFNIPINKGGIPITGQTFAVLLVGYFLGVKKGTLAVLVYLILGVLGLPIFANGFGGFEIFSGNSIGFLFGFLFGVATAGYFGELGWGNTFFKCLLGMGIGSLVIILSGLIFLTIKYDLRTAWIYGVYPFLFGALIKIIIGATIPPIYHNLIKEKARKVKM